MFVPACDRPPVAELTGAQGRDVMETGSAAIHRKMLMPARQLPITGSAHKAGNGRRPLLVAIGTAQGASRIRQQAIDGALVLIGDPAKRRRQSEHQVKIWNGQEFGFARRKPCRCWRAPEISELLFANGHRAEKLVLCRELLDMAHTPMDRSSDDDKDPDVPDDERPPCPCCGGRMQIIESFKAALARRFDVRRLDTS